LLSLGKDFVVNWFLQLGGFLKDGSAFGFHLDLDSVGFGFSFGFSLDWIRLVRILDF